MSHLFTVLFSLPFILVGGGLLVAAIYMMLTNFKLLRSGNFTIGTVTRIETSIGSEGETFYHPIIKFWTRTEKVYEFKHSIGTTTIGSYKPGREVPVVYDPENPQQARINSLFSLWFFPVLFAIFGLPFLVAGLGFVTGSFS